MAYIGQSIKNGTFTDLGFTGTFNSSTTDFNLGTQVGSAAQLLVSKNGVIQRPGTDYTLATGGTQISFTTAPASGDSIFIVEISGAVGGTITPSDDSVTASSIADDAVESEHLNNNIISGQTALGAAPADTDEFLVSDAGTIKRVDYSYIKAANTPAFKVELASNQSISDGTTTKIAWDSEIYDTDNAFASNKFTVPSGEGGKYHFSGVIIMRNIDDNEQVSVRIHVNGSDTLAGLNVYRMIQYGTGSDTFITVPISVDINLSASDYVEVFVYHNEGSSQNVDAGYSSFCGFKLTGA
jgi:hypothetical protein